MITTPEIRDTSIPEANGFFTARALARMCAVLAGDGAFVLVRVVHAPTR